MRFLKWAALGCLLTWAISAGILLLQARAVAERLPMPDWLASESPAQLPFQLVRAVLMAVCWIGSIFVWAKTTGSVAMRLSLLFLLLFFGALAGPIYILVKAHSASLPSASGAA